MADSGRSGSKTASNFKAETLQALVDPQDRLPDACNDRKVKEVRAPPNRPLSLDRVFPFADFRSRRQEPELELLKAYLVEQGSLSEDLMHYLIAQTNTVMRKEPNLHRIDGSVIIIGDIHGQFTDMMNMFSKLRQPGGSHNTTYLFMGDYVDRGEFGCEVMGYLMALKLKHPKNIYMLRGNHETREMTTSFNFREQVISRYDEAMYERFMELFDALPISAIVNGQLLCMHGGISPEITSVEKINLTDRFREPPETGILVDLLWADPFDRTSEARRHDWDDNELRQISYRFGLRPAKALLRKEKLLSIVRAHQVKPKGYQFHHWEGKDKFPTVITVFSAPDYCMGENDGAVLMSDNGKFDVRTFSEAPDQPFIVEGNQDAFSLCQPRLQALVLDMVAQILQYAQNKSCPGIVKHLSNANSIDHDYLTKIIEESNSKETGAKKIEKKTDIKIKIKQKRDKKDSAADDQKKAEDTGAMKRDMLDEIGKEMDAIDSDDEYLDLDQNATLAQHVNFFRNASMEQSKQAEKQELGLGMYKPVDQYIEKQQLIEKKEELRKKFTSSMSVEFGDEFTERPSLRPAQLKKLSGDDGTDIEVVSPDKLQDRKSKMIKDYHKLKFNTVREMDSTNEGRPMKMGRAAPHILQKIKSMSDDIEESKDAK